MAATPMTGAPGHPADGITYDTTNFLTTFDFFIEEDSTSGFVEYVDIETAVSEGLAVAGDHNSAIYIGINTATVRPSNGRKSAV
ncbi:hypothetical protein FOPG_18855 [Fusarium oxysporum f. sp. conglutinans race 2 54008]|uniref:Uncharacterized protein n=1 Tax=Fusarium oxysporum f. sp. conglutinans race 2 54008 TaxID=1089457 RepID=X0HUS1_FUSOX|nr:hypothetical protein FOPG_18855 [Fusarium oxysporum f. sp. conglutinans race 2 54008]